MQIGTRKVGAGEPVYFIAEVGSNHLGDIDQARKLIDVAADCGADAVKMQFFRADTMVAPDHPDYATFKRFEIPEWWLPVLHKRAHENAIELFYSVFSPDDVPLLNEFVNVWKVASAELTYTDLLQAVAKTGKPVIVSTGMSDDEDMETLVADLLDLGLHGRYVLLHCVSAYPAPPTEVNLHVLDEAILAQYQGLSDHTADPYAAPLMAAALGACLLEKHFTMSREDDSPDAPFALIPSELKALATSLHQAHLMLGDGVKKVQPSERAALSDRRVLIDGRWLRGYPA
jgi:sialic acid synthase SpsE